MVGKVYAFGFQQEKMVLDLDFPMGKHCQIT